MATVKSKDFNRRLWVRGAGENYKLNYFQTIPITAQCLMNPVSDWSSVVKNKLLYSLKLTSSQTTNFRLFQTERFCRQQFQIC